MMEAGWDLVVFDEAHKLAAHYFGTKLEKTARFRLAERLGERSRHLLLMTATPHNGKEEDFQLFLSLWIPIASTASFEVMRSQSRCLRFDAPHGERRARQV